MFLVWPIPEADMIDMYQAKRCGRQVDSHVYGRRFVVGSFRSLLETNNNVFIMCAAAGHREYINGAPLMVEGGPRFYRGQLPLPGNGVPTGGQRGEEGLGCKPPFNFC